MGCGVAGGEPQQVGDGDRGPRIEHGRDGPAWGSPHHRASNGLGEALGALELSLGQGVLSSGYRCNINGLAHHRQN